MSSERDDMPKNANPQGSSDLSGESRAHRGPPPEVQAAMEKDADASEAAYASRMLDEGTLESADDAAIAGTDEGGPLEPSGHAGGTYALRDESRAARRSEYRDDQLRDGGVTDAVRREP